MKIDVPVIATVDLLVIGGSINGLKAAAEAAADGFRVFCITPYSYFGEDLCACFDFQSPKTDACRFFFPEKELLTPMRVKRTLERRLLDGGIDFLYQTYPVEPILDSNGVMSGFLVANRSGFQGIRAKAVEDATERSLAARACGVSCKPFVPGTYPVERFVLGECGNDSGLTIEMLPERYRVQDREYSVFRAVKEIEFRGNRTEDFSKAELEMRHATWAPGLVAAADHCRVDLDDGVSGEYRPSESLPLLIAGRESASEISAFLKRLPLRDACGFAKKEGISDCDIVRKDRYFRFQDGPFLRYDLNRVPVLRKTGVLVIGGGTGGAPAAIASGRSGAPTLCVESLWNLGGVCTSGRICAYWFGNRVGFTRELDEGIAAMGENPPFSADSGRADVEWKKQYLLREMDAAGAEIQFGTLAVAAALQGKRLCGVVCAGPYGIGLIRAEAVIDSTGNADVAAAAGAETRMMAPGEAAVQGAGLSPVTPGISTINTDYQFICDHDVRDVTRAFVMGRAKFEAEFDLIPMVDTRERRRIVGDLVLQPEDIYGNRCYSDTITVASSNFDTHGFVIHPIFLLKAPTHDPHFARVPLRALCPAGLDGILVTGLGISAHRDCMPLLRMQPDVQNQGYAAGYAAAEAVREQISFRQLEIRKLQAHLVDKGILGAEIPEETDSIPGPDLSDPHHELAAVFLNPEFWIPVLKQRYAERLRMDDALLLASLGEADGFRQIERELADSAWDKGWDYRGMGQFGASVSRTDLLLYALSRIGNSPVYRKKLQELNAEDAFSHIRMISLALSRYPDRESGVFLERLLAAPEICGWSQNSYRDAVRANRPEYNDTSVRNSQLKELYLAKALNACCPENRRAEEILQGYRSGFQGCYALAAAGFSDGHSPEGDGSCA